MVSVDNISEMSAMELLESQWASNSAEARTDALLRLTVVAVSLGKEKALDTLVPFLVNAVVVNSNNSNNNSNNITNNNSIDDELLLILGQEIIPVVEWLHSDAATMAVLPLVERLATTEETVVRQQSVTLCEALVKINAALPLWAVAKRLASADWFTPKVSACGIIAATLLTTTTTAKANTKNELLETFGDLMADDTPMVRRAAAQYVGTVLQRAGPNTNLNLAALVRDEQDSVRLLAIGALAQVGTAFDPQFTATQWLPLVKEGSTDQSWYVPNNNKNRQANFFYSFNTLTCSLTHLFNTSL